MICNELRESKIWDTVSIGQAWIIPDFQLEGNADELILIYFEKLKIFQ